MSEQATTEVEPANAPGLTDPGILPADNPYCLALDVGYFADPSQPKEANEPYTVAGVLASAAAAKKEGT